MPTTHKIFTPDGSGLSTYFMVALFAAYESGEDPDTGTPVQITSARRTDVFRITATLQVNDMSGDALRVSALVKGSGFTYDHGKPSGGTATSISVRLAGIEDASFTGFSIPLKTLYSGLSVPLDALGTGDLIELIGARFSVFGNISFFGNAGDDTGLGGGGRDILRGSAGDDSLFGGGNRDTLNGSIGEDSLSGGFGNDRLDGGQADDSLMGGGDNDVIIGNLGNDSANGGTGNDTIYGQDGNDDLSGSFGNDVLIGGPGDDSLDGENAFDTASYGNAAAGVIVDLSNTAAQNTGGAGVDDIDDVENLAGSNFNDTLSGNDTDNVLNGQGLDDKLSGVFGNDTLLGGGGNDTLDGGTQNDRLDGGAGTDLYFGGTGKDVFAFARFSQVVSDVIADFTQGADKIDLSGIDANSIAAGNQKFTFVGNVAFGDPGDLKFSIFGGNTIIEGDVDGNGTADFKITAIGVFNLQGTDFIL